MGRIEDTRNKNVKLSMFMNNVVHKSELIDNSTAIK